jgi:F0F1-type ATP synthase membrane subunit b/b'
MDASIAARGDAGTLTPALSQRERERENARDQRERERENARDQRERESENASPSGRGRPQAG